MDGLLRTGRYLFAIAMGCFGVEYFLYIGGLKGPAPGPPWIPASHVGAVLAGAALIAVGVCLVTGRLARLSATLLGVALLLDVLFFHLPGLIAQLHNPGPWTSSFELLALMGGAFVLASTALPDGFRMEPSNEVTTLLASFGRIVFAIALVVFAVQHFLYARFVATLIPAWIPAHLFLTYFVGVAFLAAALAIATKKVARTASELLGTMFLLWVLCLHAPRVAASPRNGDEVTSLLVCLAMSGASFVLAKSFAS
ncbi:hypothetical protein [Granulicella sp. S190]|uniref:hypothetical protein n=1 Tax=Granulicella sp. S190 TaxID=1747226 RepID=UPI00131A64B7|nr:hypothetical protein [Granulicella sp. S190]